MPKLLLLNGPNLNLLGSREPEVYGATRLDDIEANCIELAEELGHTLDCYQSNAEHELVDRVQKAARDIGMLGFDVIPGVRSLFARQMMGLSGRLPRLSRGVPLK